MFHVKQSSGEGIKNLSEHQNILFKKGVQFLNFNLKENQFKQFFLYIELLLEWNKKINLFSKNDEGPKELFSVILSISMSSKKEGSYLWRMFWHCWRAAGQKGLRQVCFKRQ